MRPLRRQVDELVAIITEKDSRIDQLIEQLRRKDYEINFLRDVITKQTEAIARMTELIERH